MDDNEVSLVSYLIIILCWEKTVGERGLIGFMCFVVDVSYWCIRLNDKEEPEFLFALFSLFFSLQVMS